MEIVPQTYPLWAALTVDGEFQCARVVAWKVFDGASRPPVPIVTTYGQCALSGAEASRGVPVLLGTASDDRSLIELGGTVPEAADPSRP